MVKQATENKGGSAALEEVALLLRKSELKLKGDSLVFMVHGSKSIVK
jgi:hypothetical protein